MKNNLFFLYNKIGSNFFFALLTLDLLVVSLKFVCTGNVAEWLVLVILVHMPQRVGVGWDWVASGGSWASVHPGFITRISHLRVH